MSSPAADLLQVTDETFNMIKSVVTSGWTAGLGVQGVDLDALISLVPVETPFRNQLARIKPKMGSKFAYWRALLSVNNAQPNPAVGDDYAGGLVEFAEQDIYAPYQPLRLTGRVTQDAIDEAEGYENALSVVTMQVINQLMIGEDKHSLMSQAYSIGQLGNVSLSTAATGGLITSGTAVYVTCAPRSGINYYYGGSGAAGVAQSRTAGTTTSTNTVTATVAALPGAVAYDWFVGPSAGTQYYYTTTTVNQVTVTFLPTANQPLPGLVDLSTTAPTSPPTADTSYSTLYYNGLLASVLGDFGTQSGNGGSLVQRGTGTSSSSYYASLNGNSFTYSAQGVEEIDAMNASIWNSAKVSPTRYLMNAAQCQEIANEILGSSAATTFLQPNDIQSRQQIVAGGAVGWYLNRSVQGRPIEIQTQVNIPPGTLIAVTDQIPYPGANIEAPMSLRVQRDFAQFPYGANYVPNVAGGGPRQDFDITVRETFALKAPLTCGVLSNIP